MRPTGGPGYWIRPVEDRAKVDGTMFSLIRSLRRQMTKPAKRQRAAASGRSHHGTSGPVRRRKLWSGGVPHLSSNDGHIEPVLWWSERASIFTIEGARRVICVIEVQPYRRGVED